MKRLFCVLALAAALFGASLVAAKDSANQQSKDAKAKSAVSINDPKAFQGYTLVSPMTSKKSYLIDMEGHIVRIGLRLEVRPLLATFVEEASLDVAASVR